MALRFVRNQKQGSLSVTKTSSQGRLFSEAQTWRKELGYEETLKYLVRELKTVRTTHCLSNLYHDNLLTRCAQCTFISTVVRLLLFRGFQQAPAIPPRPSLKGRRSIWQQDSTPFPTSHIIISVRIFREGPSGTREPSISQSINFIREGDTLLTFILVSIPICWRNELCVTGPNVWTVKIIKQK